MTTKPIDRVAPDLQKSEDANALATLAFVSVFFAGAFVGTVCIGGVAVGVLLAGLF